MTSFRALILKVGNEPKDARARETMASSAASLVERREAPHPCVNGVRVPRKARGGPRHGPQGTCVNGARRLPALHSLVPRETEKRERASPAAPRAKWPGGVALAMRLFDK
jgi:hypothetical protein